MIEHTHYEVGEKIILGGEIIKLVNNVRKNFKTKNFV